ncbi:uncharacterized protein LOC135432916 [Drosophila montana]|uniref:uncharacterized protein LOC135432916 n=1 Tax=Drosophila montana TaxID=40370 RepID=UPI00313CC023
MGTPRKSSNYFSPYSQNVRQYPSQTSDYMSQHAGGVQSPYTPQDRSGQRSNQNTPHFYQSRTPQHQNSGFYEDRQGSDANTAHFYQIKSPHQQQRGSRPFGQRGGRRGHHQHRQFNEWNVNSFSQYFHNSMLEDPWRELMERHEAIHGSALNEQDRIDI